MGAIIKSGQQGGNASSIASVAFNFDDVSQRANSYLDKVREQAAEIVKQAQADAEKIREQAKQEGRRLAMDMAAEAARAQVDRHMEELRPALVKISREIDAQREVWFQRWEANAIRLAVQIAGRVLNRELQINPQVSPELVREALELISHTTRAEIRLHPEDHALLHDALQSLTTPFSDIADVQIVSDDSVGRGGCRVISDHGEVDQQIETRLARIESELLPE